MSIFFKTLIVSSFPLGAFIKSRILRLFSLALLLCTGAVSADFEGVEEYTHKLLSFDIFKGDKHGDFQNDPVVILEDGSGWKVHPTQIKIINSWKVEDKIEVDIRIKNYFRKREHKFLLVNKTQKESVNVMLVKYPDNPLIITSKDLRIVDMAYQMKLIFLVGPVALFIRFPVIKESFTLNQGSILTLESHDNSSSFKLGSKVYFINTPKGTFLISGIEREAEYVTAPSPKGEGF